MNTTLVILIPGAGKSWPMTSNRRRRWGLRQGKMIRTCLPAMITSLATGWADATFLPRQCRVRDLLGGCMIQPLAEAT